MRNAWWVVPYAWWVVPFCAAGMAAAASSPAEKSPPSATVMPLDAKVDSLGYPELTARWWQWALNAPIAPYLDPDGRFCDLGQEGPIWFLAGTQGSATVRRECVVPADKYIFLPVINMVHWQASSRTNDKKNPMPCAELQRRAALNNDHLLSAIVLIDGVPVPDVAHYRVRSNGCFPIAPEADGEADASIPRGASDGYWLLIAPLKPGRHTLVVGANYGASGGKDYGGMVQNFEYELHVGGQTNLVMAMKRNTPLCSTKTVWSSECRTPDTAL